MAMFRRRAGRPPLHEVGETPDYRFSLANERTFLAWVRTALALLAGGVAVVQIVPRFTVTGARHVLGIPLVLLAITIAATSYSRWEHRERAIRLGQPLPRSALPRIVGMGLAMVMLLALGALMVEATQRP